MMTARSVLRYSTLAVLAAACLLGRAAVDAGDTKEEKKQEIKQTPEAKAAQEVGAAYRLVSYGREKKVPEALILAARVIGTTKFENLDTADAKVEKAEQLDPFMEAEALIAEALKMESEQKETIEKLAAATRTAIKGKRGAVRGPRVIMGTLSNFDKADEYHIAFKAHEPAHIRVNNRSNRGDMDLYVYNEAGKLIARDFRPDDDAYVHFYPHQTQRYRVVVRMYSGGRGQLHYVLTTN